MKEPETQYKGTKDWSYKWQMLNVKVQREHRQEYEKSIKNHRKTRDREYHISHSR
jgi:hypothetical protein